MGVFQVYQHLVILLSGLPELLTLYVHPSEPSFGNMTSIWLNVRARSSLLRPYMEFQTNPLDSTKHSHISLIVFRFSSFFLSWPGTM